MSQSETSNLSFFDTLPPKATSEQFKDAVTQVVSQEDYDLLGDDAPELITESLAFLGAFAAEPATFDLDAVQSVTLLDEREASQIVNFAVRMGLLKRQGDRLLMDKKICDLFRSFLT